MDGSDVTVVVLGEKGVGKTTFIEKCFQDASGSARLSRHAKVVICGREVSIRMVDNPGKSQLIPAMMVVVLLDLTNKHTFDGLSRMLKLAQRISPVALKAVVGAKADLIEQRKVESQEVVSLIDEFCCEHSEGTQTIPYYETALAPSDSIFIAFQEIIARPLINDYVIKAATDQEQISFAHEVMEWSINHNSANILTHLRKLGYSIPLDIIKRYPTIIRDYLLAEYPLRVMPQFTYVDLPPPNFGLEDSSLLEDFDEEPQSLHDIRPTIEVTRTYHLCWTDISLYCFLPEFLSHEVIDVRNLTHIDLSHNRLSSLPSRILKLPRLESLNVSHNQLTSLPALESWHPSSRLQVLMASHNQIAVSNQTHQVHGRGAESGSGGAGGGGGREPFQDLWHIDLSHNQLASFPMFIFNFRQLHHLDISHNAKVTKLPTQLGRLKKLVTLVLDGLSLFHPPTFVVEEGTAAILDFMRGSINHSSPWSSMRIVVVGSKGAGKTSLVKRMKGESTSLSTATKGLDVSEWKYKGGDFLSFRNKLLTFDVWDFSGDPNYRSIYSCFNCSNSLHLVVCKPWDSPRQLVWWLSDIQSCSVRRVPVVIVFTFMDCFKTRDQREEFKKKTLNWISYHNIKGDQLKGVNLSMSSMMDSVRSLQGGDMFVPSHELPPEAFEMQEVTSEDIPIMPLVVKTLFVSNLTGENISSVRRLLYKLASNPPMAPSPHIAPFNLIGQEVPTSYVHIEQLIRQLQLKVQQNPRDGERPAFYTLTELKEGLSKHLVDLNISDSTFSTALKFLHEVGVIYVYQCRGGGPLLVSIDLQMMGSLLQKTLQATCAPHTSSPACFLANTHLAMIWGVEQILLVKQQEEGGAKESQYRNKPSSQNLLDYLYHLDICSPLFPGTSLLPSIVPSSLPKGSEPDSASLLPRRVYILNYMPSLFAFQLLSRLVASLVRDSVPCLSVSPSRTAPPPSVPLVLPSGIQLYLWRRNVFVVDSADGSKFWVRVREGRLESEGEELPYAGRVDVQLEAGPEREVKWLRLITAEIDHLLKVDYPCLLETQRCVEVCASLSLPEVAEETSDPSDLELSNGHPPPSLPTVPVSDLTHSLNNSKSNATNCQPPPPPTTANQLPGNQDGGAKTLSPATHQEYSQSWEVVSRQSTTSSLLTMRQDIASPNQQLIPLWECLQEAFKTPMVRVGSHRVKLQQVIPDLLFNDFAPELLFRTTLSAPDMFLMSLEEHMNGGIPPPEDTGRYLRLYYTQENEDHSIIKIAGAEKAFYLQSRLVHLRSDFFRLQQLQSPHLVLPLGVNYSPPCMALESAPHGSLKQLLRINKGASIGRNIIHHIALQLIAGLEFLHLHKFRYHGINSSNVLIWNLDPITIKLSDSGITHPPSNCNLCSYLDSTLGDSVRRSTSQRIDYILLGLLVFEMATGQAPFEGIYPPSTVVRAILHDKLQLSIEAQHFLQAKLQEESDCEQSVATGCQRLCLQSTMEECILRNPVNHRDVKIRFSLCAGDHLWSPMRMLVNVECMLCSEDAELVYWASGSRGLVTGTIAPNTGHLDYNILQEAPPPESGLFADRRCKPVPIAVGRATGLALVQRTKQLWVSTENGQMGSVYVFNLPDMRRHHHIHLQDAALCVQAVNDRTAQSGAEELAYRALVGLANGTIIVFLGVMEGGRVLENPLQGPKLVAVTHQRRPCLSLLLTPTGHIWCSCGDTMEVLDAATMKVIRRLATSEGSLNNGRGQVSSSKGKGDVITLMAVNGRGVWTVGRRSKQLKLWDQITASLKGCFTAVTACDQENCDITALAVQGGVIWLGTRNGYVLLLDAAVMEEGGDPLLGLQYCGEGKVRCIIPLSPQKGITKSLQVICSVEFPDEVSGALLCWEYLSSSRASGHSYGLSRSASAPAPLPLPQTGQESPCLDLREQCKSFSPTSF